MHYFPKMLQQHFMYIFYGFAVLVEWQPPLLPVNFDVSLYPGEGAAMYPVFCINERNGCPNSN